MTSRWTAAQIIAAGNYLNEDFDPSTLTVNQLLGVFGYHNVAFPAPYTKPKLVALFNEQIKPNSAKFKKAKLQKDNSIASDDGITDGVTGKPLSKKPPSRRTSRRASREPTIEPQGSEEDQPSHLEPPKRRRSSVQPSLGGPSRRRTSVQPTLAEESEPEEEQPVRKVSRSKKTSTDAGTQSRRISDQFAEDSGWEDNNVFQSGAEDSPVRRSPAKRQPRRSSVSRSVPPRRKSMSAPPQLPPSPERPTPPASPLISRSSRQAPQSDFAPDLTPEAQRHSGLFARALSTQPSLTAITPQHHRSPVAVPSVVIEEDEPISQEIPLPQESPPPSTYAIHNYDEETREDRQLELEDELSEDEEQDDSDADAQYAAAVMKRIADGGGQTVAIRRSSPSTSITSSILRTLFLLLTTSLALIIHDRQVQSAELGFCDAGTKTNDAVESRIITWQTIEECNRHNTTLALPDTTAADLERLTNVEEITFVAVTDCPKLPILPLPPPTECTPCPPHAKCSQFTVTCDTGYQLRPHALLGFLPPPPSDLRSNSPASSPSEYVWHAIFTALNGLPGVGSVAFPPRCVEDLRRKRNIGALGRAVDSLLAQEKGRRVCSGRFDSIRIEESAGGEARKWGMELGALKDVMKRKTAPHLVGTFEDTFMEAVQQLTQWGGVITGEDTEGRQYLARDMPDMSWNCILTVKARETWQQWRSRVLTAFLFLIAAIYGKRKRTAKRAQDKRVAGLAQLALDALHNQELSHYTDPVRTTAPYLSSLQLRDLVLQDEPSVSARAKLWDRVERVVEANANVRANLEELPGGDEMRVWRWIGTAGSHQLEAPE